MQIASTQPSEAAPQRIRELSVLPVFLDLAGKRAVVAGGSAAAAWKAELLCAAGARVEVYAPPEEVAEELLDLVARGVGATLITTPWDADGLRGAALAIADARSQEEAAAFSAAARDAGVICNIIDRPEFGQFQFGTIVNRSPVVVGISTSGAAPILAQAIRRRIEALLPRSLAQWAGFARDWRDRVAARLQLGSVRRAFWERFVDLAFGPAPNASSHATLDHVLDTASGTKGHGHVTFVGAGPGDAELLTLRAMRALQAADVILFDDLVSGEVLELARREAKRIRVGKRAGRPSCAQHEINSMMVALAKSGRRVVRLKSGDPMIFGRAGEEIEVLEQAGIGYDVVPGITAALAMAARLGVSLTHRDCARSVRFVTGHAKDGGLPRDIDWSAIADPSVTTIFYMAGRKGTEISAMLHAQGLPAETPVAIAAEIGRANETTMITDLAGLPASIAVLDREMTVLIGVGSVFGRRAGSSTRLLGSQHYAPTEQPGLRPGSARPVLPIVLRGGVAHI